MKVFKNRHHKHQCFQILDRVVRLLKEYGLDIDDVKEYLEKYYKHKGDKITHIRRGHARKKQRLEALKTARERMLANKKKMKAKTPKAEKVAAEVKEVS